MDSVNRSRPRLQKLFGKLRTLVTVLPSPTPGDVRLGLDSPKKREVQLEFDFRRTRPTRTRSAW